MPSDKSKNVTLLLTTSLSIVIVLVIFVIVVVPAVIVIRRVRCRGQALGDEGGWRLMKVTRIDLVILTSLHARWPT